MQSRDENLAASVSVSFSFAYHSHNACLFYLHDGISPRLLDADVQESDKYGAMAS